MPPEWRCSISFDLKEEERGDRVNRLDEVFADKETALVEMRAGAHPLLRVWSVFFV